MMELTSTLMLLIFMASTGAGKKVPDFARLKLNKKNPVDPGPCGKITHGKMKLVKDRLGEDKIIACIIEDSNYFWKSIDGSSTVGEFFDPAIDCSDVVDRAPEATNGFYWLHPKAVKKAVKAWCDVTTDGGGYLLVAKKNDPITWTVPSTNETVDPHGKPHWSSIFGDMKMLDVRFQFSTTSDFKHTKADWSFRFTNKRPFSELLIRDKNGCSKHNPGIGDIKYVKDLQVGKIVNTNFHCSLFGSHTSSFVGWGMMNKCLKKSCPLGFAYFPGLPFKLDDSGSFSYSAHGRTKKSGILYQSTAFIGCSSGKCCACYGPKGGTKNYCLNNCTAINGGHYTKKVHAWIWIRSSLPQRVWRECIEYKVKGENGEDVTYMVNPQTGVGEKGSCSNPGDIKQNNGVLIVPNRSAVKKVPPAPGLLLYQPSDKQLFIKGNKHWNRIAMQRKVIYQQQLLNQQVNKTEQNLEKKINLVQNHLKKKQRDTETYLKNQHLKQQQKLQKQLNNSLNQQKTLEKELDRTKLELEQQIRSLNTTLYNLRDILYTNMMNCKELKRQKPGLSNRQYLMGSFWTYCDMSNNGWTLIARFSNKDSKNWISNGNLWYDRNTKFGSVTNPAENGDMISEAFWRVRGEKFKITRSDDSSHTALLQTTTNCLRGGTFRSKITGYGNFRNGAVWASDQCRGSCPVSYGGQYKSTAGFEKYSCSSDIQSSNYIGFWCNWSSGDGAVMMIGGGGSGCNRADHGIGITEENAAKFGGTTPHYDFGYEANNNLPSSYSLNLWVR